MSFLPFYLRCYRIFDAWHESPIQACVGCCISRCCRSVSTREKDRGGTSIIAGRLAPAACWSLASVSWVDDLPFPKYPPAAYPRCI
ncbi:hypothetical protein TVNIR_2019 [Thioalkalivibrio nitratireducens DSM 14787]|uniref:Uncharacterized protein n=1 Tax=Thioalkalivibrio nitratireducens (strain DSM 14787 / UNIQEM 213 / ALEN2) TaxID=1255043 RepID=L0DXI9_THIND|nr:hypothetical protein TVNIR_2019 [Thioalkalivibrio nitratireducens DSM 14787]